MVFPSIINWTALLVLAAVYWLMPARFRLSVLAAGSFALLAFNDFLTALLALYLILLCQIAVGFVGREAAKSKRLRMWVLLTLSLAPLVLLKYQGLLGIDALQRSGALPIDLGALAAPLGISYLTFKAIMYIVEAGRGALPSLSLPALAAYIVFAPSATSGPIDQPKRFIEQLLDPGKLDLDRVVYAMYRIATGVIFKFVIADTIGEISDAFVPDAMAVSLKHLLVFGPYYSFWLYFDFAGYSHIAIGAAYLFGVKCMENFAAPLLRPNISEFWRAWHISLTTFLRTYIFLPCAYRWSKTLGPQRAAYAATVLAFAVCGVWHGDGLNFLLWGLYHGILLSLHQAFIYNTRKVKFFARLRKKRWLAVPAWALTFVLVSLGWFPFAFSITELHTIIVR